jgi:hypothetical protein
METLKQYLIPYILSNALFLSCLVLSIKKPIWSRVFLTILFLGAAYVNYKTASTNPDVYLDYARFAVLPFYRQFINGFFSHHVRPFVILIASGEFCISIGLVLNKGFVKMACIGGILFGLAITPLGIGSAFPATIFMAVAFWALYHREGHDYIWKWRQYARLNPFISKKFQKQGDEIIL